MRKKSAPPRLRALTVHFLPRSRISLMARSLLPQEASGLRSWVIVDSKTPVRGRLLDA
jgi:hypothetical protein